MSTTIAVISDTHMPRGNREVPARCLQICEESDLIIHAGDFMETSALEMFESVGPPLVGVHGNVDSPELRERLPARRTIEMEGLRLGVIHDAGTKRGRLARLNRLFPDHAAVIFGHSHLPLHEEEGGFQIFNPGSPTERRRSPFKSMGRATVQGSRIRFELVDLGT